MLEKENVWDACFKKMIKTKVETAVFEDER